MFPGSLIDAQGRFLYCWRNCCGTGFSGDGQCFPHRFLGVTLLAGTGWALIGRIDCGFGSELRRHSQTGIALRPANRKVEPGSNRMDTVERSASRLTWWRPSQRSAKVWQASGCHSVNLIWWLFRCGSRRGTASRFCDQRKWLSVVRRRPSHNETMQVRVLIRKRNGKRNRNLISYISYPCSLARVQPQGPCA